MIAVCCFREWRTKRISKEIKHRRNHKCASSVFLYSTKLFLYSTNFKYKNLIILTHNMGFEYFHEAFEELFRRQQRALVQLLLL